MKAGTISTKSCFLVGPHNRGWCKITFEKLQIANLTGALDIINVPRVNANALVAYTEEYFAINRIMELNMSTYLLVDIPSSGKSHMIDSTPRTPMAEVNRLLLFGFNTKVLRCVR